MDRLSRVIGALGDYPTLSVCFSRYLQTIMDRCADPEIYNMVWAIEEHDHDWMRCLDGKLRESRCILGIDSGEGFAAAFGFDRELSPRPPALPDQDKANDLLAEALFPLDFAARGFTEIRRITEPYLVGRRQVPQADFSAVYRDERVAIEVKTVRPESWALNGQSRGHAALPNWWNQMFVRDITRKLTQNGGRTLQQLENTCQRENCTRKLLAVCVRRIGVTSAMRISENNYRDELDSLMSTFPELDYMCIKENDCGRLIMYP